MSYTVRYILPNVGQLIQRLELPIIQLSNYYPNYLTARYSDIDISKIALRVACEMTVHIPYTSLYINLVSPIQYTVYEDIRFYIGLY